MPLTYNPEEVIANIAGTEIKGSECLSFNSIPRTIVAFEVETIINSPAYDFLKSVAGTGRKNLRIPSFCEEELECIVFTINESTFRLELIDPF